MAEAGTCPRIFAGTRFYVNYPRFKEQLEAGEIGAQPQRSGEATEEREEA